MEAAVRAARVAAEANAAASLGARRRWVEAMREAARKMVPSLARFAVEETGYGRIEDKLKKNTLVVDKTPGPEILRAGRVLRRRWADADRARQLRRHRLASRPTTNPTETIICNAIGMVAGGNAVVFNAHPYAARTSRTWFVHLLNEAIVAAGGPENLHQLRRAADHRERRGADAPSRRAPRRGHRRSRRRQGGDGPAARR